MHVASLADCKELYKVSGWDGTTFSWYCDEERDDDPALNLSEPVKVLGGVGYFDHKYPAYDMAYLTEMLPAHALSKHGNGNYTAWRMDHTVRVGFTSATSRSNAANALCRLAIKLFEHGVLLRRTPPASQVKDK